MEQIFVDKMTDGTRELGITLSEQQLEQFYRYYKLLVEWNKVMNLTGITELEEVVSKHFIDSLALVKAVPLQDGRKVSGIDVGTGAGFPGIPLKIAFPNLKITLLDSLNKRIKFLNEVISQLWRRFMEGQRTLDVMQNTGSSMITAYLVPWLMPQHFLNTVCRL